MEIIKSAFGTKTRIKLVKLKDLGKFSLYQAYKIKGDKLIPLYKETYNAEQIEQIKRAGNIVEEDVLLWKYY